MKISIFPSLKCKIYCSAALACFALAASVPAAAQRLPSTVVPTHYSLAVTPDLKAATFSGIESIDIEIKQPINVITLNAIEIAFQSVTIDAGREKQTAIVSLDSVSQQAALTFPNTLPEGRARLKIRFTGILNNELRGFYLSRTAKRNYAVTQLESTDARRAFPCFDEPALKATFDVSLTIDAGDSAISNSPIAGDKPGPGADKHTITFATTPKMSTYLLAYLVGDFQCTGGEQDGVELRVCATPDKVALTSFALDVAKFSLHYYDDYFGIHYPLKKLDLIAIPDFEAGAMENFGAITFREVDLLIDPKTASLHNQIEAARDVTHEIAHQWFGDLVTMQWWDNIWLNEGFATWMESKPVAAMHPEWGVPQIVASEDNQTLDVDAQPTTRAIRATAETPEEINQMFDDIAYGKAGAVLLMVENYVGEDTFRKGVHAYLAAHEYGNATAEDFWNAQTAVSNKPVNKIMESLVAQPGVPILTFSAPQGGKVPVVQTRFFLSPSVVPDPAQQWTLPVCFKNGSSQECEVLSPSTRSLRTPDSSIFFANAGGMGYYRVAFSPEQYGALLSQAETTLTADERISLAGDEWAQVRANDSTIGDYMSLVAAFKADPNADVLSSTFVGLTAINNQAAATADEHGAIDQWIRMNFASVYARLATPAPGDSPNTRKLRASLLGLLASHGDQDAVARAREYSAQYLADPTSVDPSLGQTALAATVQHGDAALFDKLQKIYEASTDPTQQDNALLLLAHFTDPALLDRMLAYAVSSNVRNQDTARVLGVALANPRNREQAWSFIKTHWSQIAPLLTTESGEMLVDYTGTFCTAEAREDVKSFFAAHPVQSADSYLHHALERIDGCIELRKLQEPNLQKWLATQSGGLTTAAN